MKDNPERVNHVGRPRAVRTLRFTRRMESLLSRQSPVAETSTHVGTDTIAASAHRLHRGAGVMPAVESPYSTITVIFSETMGGTCGM